MRNIKFALVGLLAFLIVGAGIQLQKQSVSVKAEGETYVTASNLKLDKDSGTKGLNFSGDRINGVYFTADANDAPFDGWNIEYDMTEDNNISILKADGTYIEEATKGIRNSAIIVKFSETKHYIKIETWTIGSYSIEEGDTLTIRGAFKQHNGGSCVYTMPETSFYISTEDQPIVIPDTVNKINPTAVSAPEYNDQKWHFQFLAKGINETTMPFTSGSTDDSFSYVATSNNNIYLNENPIGKVNKNALRRRDSWLTKDALIYVCNQNESDSQVVGGHDIYPEIGDIVTFDGIFVHNNPEMDVAIEFDNLSLIKVGTGVADYESVDLKEHLITDLNDNYNPAIYNDEDVATITSLLSQAEEAIEGEEEVSAIYEVYGSYKTQLEAYDYNPDKASQYLASIKEAAINEINQYANLDLYFENERNEILSLIATYTTSINNASKKSEIDGYVSAFKAAVDNIATDVDVMQDAILNEREGYEQYLKQYDRVSLNSLNLNTLTYHGDSELRHNSDLNTNSLPAGLNNLFVPSRGNEDGNVAFQFAYTPESIPNAGANIMVVLRGITACGYKFAIDTPTRGLYLEMVNEAGQGNWIGGTGNIFTKSKTYSVEIGAIDLINEVNLTYLYVKVDGAIVYKTIQNSFSFCHNPRVSISPNDNWGETIDGTFYPNDYEGEVVISSLNEGIEQTSSTYLGSFKADTDPHSDSKNTIYAKMRENSLKVGETFYPLAPENVTLVRGSSSRAIANPSLSFITKYNDDSYSLNVKSLIDPSSIGESIQDGDEIIVQGVFAGFDEETEVKYSFSVSKTTFIYRSSSNSWEVVLTLEDAKINAINELNNYADLSLYDEAERTQIQNIIDTKTTEINNATSVDEVNALLSSALNDIDNILTTLGKAKNRAIEEVNLYKADQMDNYRADERSDIETLRQEAIVEIGNASSQEEINKIVIDFKMKVDALKTKAEYEKEELDEAKNEASEEIRNRYAALVNSGKYIEADLDALNQATRKAIQDIESATTIEEVNDILSSYLSTYPIEENASPNNGNAWLIPVVVASSVVVLAGAALVTILLLKKNKKKKGE